eukprot:TRINITY_DN43153_c0_g1_i1.p1 TRINITY_DN43153_c0_g1~~TRINITY_DN43153_c0_g1_i1.p1  ORF type:complete len:1374 (-),score=165.68 TRINITY_DN43153_c0_g1_i1:80-4201(-)
MKLLKRAALRGPLVTLVWGASWALVSVAATVGKRDSAVIAYVGRDAESNVVPVKGGERSRQVRGSEAAAASATSAKRQRLALRLRALRKSLELVAKVQRSKETFLTSSRGREVGDAREVRRSRGVQAELTLTFDAAMAPATGPEADFGFRWAVFCALCGNGNVGSGSMSKCPAPLKLEDVSLISKRSTRLATNVNLNIALPLTFVQKEAQNGDGNGDTDLYAFLQSRLADAVKSGRPLLPGVISAEIRDIPSGVQSILKEERQDRMFLRGQSATAEGEASRPMPTAFVFVCILVALQVALTVVFIRLLRLDRGRGGDPRSGFGIRIVRDRINIVQYVPLICIIILLVERRALVLTQGHAGSPSWAVGLMATSCFSILALCSGTQLHYVINTTPEKKEIADDLFAEIAETWRPASIDGIGSKQIDIVEPPSRPSARPAANLFLYCFNWLAEIGLVASNCALIIAVYVMTPEECLGQEAARRLWKDKAGPPWLSVGDSACYFLCILGTIVRIIVDVVERPKVHPNWRGATRAIAISVIASPMISLLLIATQERNEYVFPDRATDWSDFLEPGHLYAAALGIYMFMVLFCITVGNDDWVSFDFEDSMSETELYMFDAGLHKQTHTADIFLQNMDVFLWLCKCALVIHIICSKSFQSFGDAAVAVIWLVMLFIYFGTHVKLRDFMLKVIMRNVDDKIDEVKDIIKSATVQTDGIMRLCPPVALAFVCLGWRTQEVRSDEDLSDATAICRLVGFLGIGACFVFIIFEASVKIYHSQHVGESKSDEFVDFSRLISFVLSLILVLIAVAVVVILVTTVTMDVGIAGWASLVIPDLDSTNMSFESTVPLDTITSCILVFAFLFVLSTELTLLLRAHRIATQIVLKQKHILNMVANRTIEGVPTYVVLLLLVSIRAVQLQEPNSSPPVSAQYCMQISVGALLITFFMGLFVRFKEMSPESATKWPLLVARTVYRTAKVVFMTCLCIIVAVMVMMTPETVVLADGRTGVPSPSKQVGRPIQEAWLWTLVSLMALVFVVIMVQHAASYVLKIALESATGVTEEKHLKILELHGRDYKSLRWFHATLLAKRGVVHAPLVSLTYAIAELVQTYHGKQREQEFGLSAERDSPKWYITISAGFIAFEGLICFAYGFIEPSDGRVIRTAVEYTQNDIAESDDDADDNQTKSHALFRRMMTVVLLATRLLTLASLATAGVFLCSSLRSLPVDASVSKFWTCGPIPLLMMAAITVLFNDPLQDGRTGLPLTSFCAVCEIFTVLAVALRQRILEIGGTSAIIPRNVLGLVAFSTGSVIGQFVVVLPLMICLKGRGKEDDEGVTVRACRWLLHWMGQLTFIMVCSSLVCMIAAIVVMHPSHIVVASSGRYGEF